MKWIFLIIVSFIFTTHFAETKKYIADSYLFSSKNKIGKWKECNIEIVWEKDSNLVKINSLANQKIFYLKMATYDLDSVKIDVANSIDENNLKILFKYIEYKEGCKFMEITYSNIQYIYTITEIK